ncbi:uncharacterized protein LOC144072632 isoform X2 [Stigmatopora argus]
MAYSTSTLAQGCFGKVYREKYNDTWAAIKKIPQHLIDRKDLERECQVYNKADHPNIVKLLGNINLKEGKWNIPLEFIFGEDLETTIFKSAKSKIQLTPAIRGKIIIGMCEGLLHLHSKDIVYQDLKPDNIMVEHNTNRAVIIDLGLAKFYRRGLNSAIDMGNEAYSAPEVLRRRGQRDQRSDVWAMGKLIAELYARVRLHTPGVCPAKIREVLGDQPYCKPVSRMVESDPALRASMVGVIGELRRALGEQARLAPPIGQARNRSASPGCGSRSPTHNRPALSPTQIFQLGWDRTPRPDVKVAHRHPPAKPRSLSPPRRKAGGPGMAVAMAGPADLTRDLVKMGLYQEANRELMCQLPATGRLVVRRFEEKNGEVEKWAEKELVLRDGKIVQYRDVTFNI